MDLASKILGQKRVNEEATSAFSGLPTVQSPFALFLPRKTLGIQKTISVIFKMLHRHAVAR
jgi:hypothetical protein